MYFSDKHQLKQQHAELREVRISADEQYLESATDAERQLQQLMSACQQGDRRAFEQLYQLTSARLTGIAFRLTGSLDSANDILQESFIQVWRNCQQYHSDKGQVMHWLIGIVRFRALDKLRADQRTATMFAATVADVEQLANAVDSGGVNDGAFAHNSLQHCLATLSKTQRASILMAYFHGHNREQIAQQLNAPISTVKSWLRRGLGRLKSCLSH